MPSQSALLLRENASTLSEAVVSPMTTNETHIRTRILISDSDDLSQAIAAVQANGEPCETVAVSDGVTAIHTLLDSAFDLVIIDLSMPRLDGLRLIALIHATPQLRHLPILAIASSLEPSSTLEGIRAGADDYLPRPIEWPLLTMRIRQLVGKH